eukprot:TRINITY_DN3314_c0_g2_i1.p1 TRINITY_DN3314_c0_g2~~TRINITY_DN3314_c0_g2_i1.p1  ORF type:complete len:192 (-),score=18.87 TRINITY_DN3314_c0_g2_i1:12-587(-)
MQTQSTTRATRNSKRSSITPESSTAQSLRIQELSQEVDSLHGELGVQQHEIRFLRSRLEHLQQSSIEDLAERRSSPPTDHQRGNLASRCQLEDLARQRTTPSPRTPSPEPVAVERQAQHIEAPVPDELTSLRAQARRLRQQRIGTPELRMAGPESLQSLGVEASIGVESTQSVRLQTEKGRTSRLQTEGGQ